MTFWLSSYYLNNIFQKVLELEYESAVAKPEAQIYPTDEENVNENDQDESMATSTIVSESTKDDSDSDKTVEKELIAEEVLSISPTEKDVSTPNLAKVEMNDDDDDETQNEVSAEEESLEEGEIISENPYKETK